MKNLDKLKNILDLAKSYESPDTDGNLVEGVKKTTRVLIEKNPEITFNDILMNLLMSARESYKYMLNSDEIEGTVDIFMDLVKMIVEDEESEEIPILRFIFKNLIVQNMLQKSFELSVKAVEEVWIGREKME